MGISPDNPPSGSFKGRKFQMDYTEPFAIPTAAELDARRDLQQRRERMRQQLAQQQHTTHDTIEDFLGEIGVL